VLIEQFVLLSNLGGFRLNLMPFFLEGVNNPILDALKEIKIIIIWVEDIFDIIVFKKPLCDFISFLIANYSIQEGFFFKFILA